MNSETLKYSKLDVVILVFLGIAVITSQLSIASSSIGIAGLIILFAVKIVKEKDFPLFDKKLLIILLAFLVWQLIVSFFSDDPGSSVTASLQKAVLYFIIICSVKMINSKFILKKFLAVFFIFTSLVSVYESLMYIIDFTSQDSSALSDFRLSYFGYPITIGEIKMLILLLIIPFILSNEKFIFNNWILLLISLPVLLSLYFTNTRNAVLGLFIGLLAIGVMKHRYFLLGFIAAVILFLYFAPQKFNERIVSIAELNHPSNAARFVMWKIGLKMISDKPITGFGDVDFPRLYKKYKEPESYGEGSHMHNNFIHIAVLYGLTGLVIWLALIIYITLKMFRVYNKVKNDELLNIITISSIACMFAFIISGLTEWNFGDAEFVVVLWFAIALPFIAVELLNTAEA